MGKIKNLLRNKWVGFTLAALLYTLWFVVWTGNLWLLLGLPVIFDLYITKFFYRYVWSHNVKMCQRSKTYRTVYEWVNAIIFATVVATLVHLFIFQMYVIPTSSMERTLLIGDYLYVSKVAYGPQMPNTPLSFPFVHHTMPFSQTKKSFSEAIKWPYHRLKGLKPIRRNDVVVFNFPAGDTVQLTAENLPLFRRIIEAYEGHTLEERDGRIVIDGKEATEYTFAMNYYWMMGDNRHNSADSRFWGFVPEDHIVGKASFVWLSLDAEKSFPANIRWERLFRKVR